MAEIDVDRASGELLFNGQVVAKAVEGVAPSILEAFYVMAETQESAVESEDRVDKAEDEVAALEEILREIKALCE